MMEERGEIYQGETARCIFIRSGPVGSWLAVSFHFNLTIQLDFPFEFAETSVTQSVNTYC